MKKITFIGLLFLFIETKELCEVRAKLETSSNFKIYLGKTDDYPPSPIQNCQSSEWTLCFSMQTMRAHSKQSTNRRYKEMSVWHQVNLTIYPPFETARARSELFTFQCGQWEPIWNSQLIGRYKEMSVWHQVNLTIYPPFETARAKSELFVFQMQSMRAHTKQSTNRKI